MSDPAQLKEAYLAELFADIDKQTEKLSGIKADIEKATKAFEVAEARYKDAVDQYTNSSTTKITNHIQEKTRESIAVLKADITADIRKTITEANKSQPNKDQSPIANIFASVLASAFVSVIAYFLLR